MKRGLIDEFIITVIPVFLGSGIALFKPGGQQTHLELAGIRSFPSGVVQTHYLRKWMPSPDSTHPRS
jgi:dihydrofolate reductase